MHLVTLEIIIILRDYPHPSLNESLKASGKYFCLNEKKHLNISFVTVTIDFYPLVLIIFAWLG
jgi:hypothetical protein